LDLVVASSALLLSPNPSVLFKTKAVQDPRRSHKTVCNRRKGEKERVIGNPKPGQAQRLRIPAQHLGQGSYQRGIDRAILGITCNALFDFVGHVRIQEQGPSLGKNSLLKNHGQIWAWTRCRKGPCLEKSCFSASLKNVCLRLPPSG
jgi:hypothetical protein